MAWVATESFDSYSNGNDLNSLNGGSGWSAAWTGTAAKYSISNSSPYDGTLCVTATNPNSNMTRTLTTAVTSGVLYFATKYSSAGDNDFQFDLKTAGNNSYRCSMRCEAGVYNIKVFANATTTLLSGFTQSQWYLWEVTFIDTSHASFRIHNGTSWSTTTGSLLAAFTGTIDQVGLNAGGGETIGFDAISATNPIVSDLTISKTESITIAESVSLTLIHNVSKSDSITISESVSRDLSVSISKTESITVTEAITMLETSFISKSDSITLAESLSMAYVSTISVSDSLTIAESVSISNANLGGISVTDSLTLTESVTGTATLGGISVADTLALAESINIALTNSLSVSDAITIADSVSARSTLGSISVSDAVTITSTAVTVNVGAAKSGIAIMRGGDQQYPLGMDDQTIF